MEVLINRRLAIQVEVQRTKFPVLAITGPRQSGKTTMLKSMFPEYRYVSLEDPDIRVFAQEDPVGFMTVYEGMVILDEVQRVPDLFSYIQTHVDNFGLMGQFVLSGSQNFQLLRGITQSLAGRVALFKLLPLDMKELDSVGLLENDYADAAVRGFYPAIYHRKIDPAVFYANYIQTYVERDVSELDQVKDIQGFRTFLGLCAARAGQLLNISALANECNIAHATAKAWLSILESSYIVFLLYPYHENFGKRRVKTPKLYFYDTGLLCHLLDIGDGSQLKLNRLKGNVFENMVLTEFQKANEHLYLHQQYYFWQDSNANEVDVLVKRANGFRVYEIKATQTISSKLFKGLDHFAALAEPEPVGKTLIYGGNQDQRRTQYMVRSWRNIDG
ncbi:ATP-binding protein [Olivibacter sitiensis]|uniref:ATP-binding protein n=1 Tax=Olivibacter sitiensis TaxID=376470 RepID=UPI0004838A41|nr:ATP-binding protein [Olivibacter sitiensis]